MPSPASSQPRLRSTTPLLAQEQQSIDRMWAMPLDEEGFGPQIYESSNADLCNTGGRPGGSCTAALFLKNFVHGLEEGEGEGVKWAHVDIAGTMEATTGRSHIRGKG
jgi:aminopeptidase